MKSLEIHIFLCACQNLDPLNLSVHSNHHGLITFFGFTFTFYYNQVFSTELKLRTETRESVVNIALGFKNML